MRSSFWRFDPAIAILDRGADTVAELRRCIEYMRKVVG